MPKYAYATALSSNPSGLVRFGGFAIFTANDGTHGTELWRSDGTLDGTTMVADIVAGTEGSTPRIIGEANGSLFFTAFTPPTTSVWHTDGTTAGTSKIADLPGSVYATTLTIAGNRLFGFTSYPSRLWSLDLATGSALDFSTGFSFNTAPAGWGSDIFFAASDSVVGNQLWMSDGTPEGTHVVRRGLECPGPWCGPAPLQFFKTAGRLCFRTQAEIWTTDGTPEGTISLGPCANGQIVATSTAAAYLSCASGLLRTDGSPAGTRVVGPVLTSTYGTVQSDGSLILISTIPATSSSPAIYELWKSDGTTSSKLSTLPFSPTVIDPGGYYYSPYAAVGSLGAKILLSGAATPNQNELWSIDVLTGAAALVKDIDPRPGVGITYASNPYVGVAFGSRIVFPATSSSGRELWETDGTTDGTRLFDNIAPDSSGGKLSGTVRDAVTNAPVPNAKIILCSDSRCYNPDVAFSAADGTYSFEPMNPGSLYRVFAQATSYVSQSWPTVNCGDCPLRNAPNGYLSAASTVSIMAGMETTGVDFALVRGGSIAIKAHSVTTGLTVTSFSTVIRSSSGDVMQYLWPTPPNQIATSVALAPGDYTVETQNHAGWADQVFDGHDCPASGCDFRVGDRIGVTEGVTVPIELSLKDLGRIAGTVVESGTGLAVPGITVRFVITNSTYSYYMTALTDGSGHYLSPPLPTGSWYVAVPQADTSAITGVLYPNLPCSSSYMCATTGGTPVAVTPATTTTGIDMAVTRRSGWGRISGRIFDRDGAPLEGAPIGFFVGTQTSTYLTMTTTADGSYGIYLAPGTYKMVVVDEAYPGGVFCSYGNCPNIDAALPISVSDGSTAILNMQIDVKRSIISGRISDAATAQSLYSTVIVFNASGRSVGNVTAYTDSGPYSISVIGRDDPLYVRASSDQHRPAAYGDVSWPCDSYACDPPTGATPIPAGIRNDIDIHLEPYATITGTVTDIETGLPVPYISVRVEDSSGNFIRTISTDYYGRFTFSSADGSYYFSIDTFGYLPQIYRDTTCTSTCEISQGVAVTAAGRATVTGIDFHLQPVHAAQLKGRVVDDLTGAGIPNVSIWAESAGASTDSNGYYTITGLPTSSVNISARPSAPYFYAWYGGANCADYSKCDRSSAAFVQITSPNTTSGIDFRLIRVDIASIQPASGFTTGGTEIHIIGSNFTPGATVAIDGKNAAVIRRSATELVVLSPASSAPGSVHVRVQDSSDVYVTAAHAFTYVTAPFLISAHSSPAAISIATTLPAGTTSATLFRRQHGTTDWTAIPWSGPGAADPTDPARGVVYDYHVEAIVSGAMQISNTASSILFTDDPIIAGETVIKRAHFAEVMDATNALRASAGLGPMTLDGSAGSIIFAQELNQLRTAILQARNVLGLGAPVFSDPVVSVGMPVRAAHIQELRDTLR